MDVSPLSLINNWMGYEFGKTVQPQIDMIKKIFMLNITSNENSNRETTPNHSATFYNRVSADTNKHPVMWSMIAAQVAVVVQSLIFRTFITTIGNLCVLGAFFYMRYLIEENENLGTMKEQLAKMSQSNQEFKSANESMKKELDEFKSANESMSQSNQQLQLEVAKIEKNNESMKKELDEFKSATSHLISTISKIEGATESLSSTLSKEGDNLTHQISRLNQAIRIFIDFAEKKDETWMDFKKTLESYQTQTKEAEIKATERERHAGQLNDHLVLIQQSLKAETAHLADVRGQIKAETLGLSKITQSLNAICQELQNAANSKKAWSQQEIQEFVNKLLKFAPNRNNHILGSQEVSN